MSEIDNSWDAGVFVGYQYINVQGIPWIARANVGVQWNLNDEYDDAYWWASGQFFFPLREDLFVGLGGGLGGGSSSFNQTYFGVTPANAVASGLPVYSARRRRLERLRLAGADLALPPELARRGRRHVLARDR